MVDGGSDKVEGTRVTRDSRTDGGIFSGRVFGLDALRALAVVLVFVFHVFPGSLPGGFLGVDVFFVVSGFLITGLLLDERRRTGRISLAAFWQRRARRLVPALVLTVLLCTALATAVGGDVLVGIRRQVVGALTFTNNWVSIGAGASYTSDFSPELFAHTWSLGIEEQFYLVWPLLLTGLSMLTVVVARRRGCRARLLVTLATVATLAGIASAAAMAVLVGDATAPTRVYYGTDTHLFGLMTGALLAIGVTSRTGGRALAGWRRRRSVRRSAVAVVALGVAGLCAAAASMVWQSTATYRGGLVLVSLVTAAVILGLLVVPDLSREAERGAMRWVGVRSYGLYLFHWPLFVLASDLLPRWPMGLLGALVVLVSVPLAALSYRYVEEPVRRHGWWPWVRTVTRRLRGLRVPRPTAVRTRVAAVTMSLVVVGAAVGFARAPGATDLDEQIAAGARIAALTMTDDGSADAVAVDGHGTDGSGTDDLPTGSAAAPPQTAPSSGKGTGSAVPGETGTTLPGTAAPPATPSTPPRPVPPTGKHVTVIGDSVTLASAAALTKALPGVAIDAEVGRQMRSVPAIVRSLRKHSALRTYVVISLGTNSTVDDGLMADVVRAVGSGHVIVLVNGYGDRPWIGPTNKALRRAAAKYRDVLVADWNSAVAAHPDKILGPDGIHPLPSQTRVYSDVVTARLHDAEPLSVP